MARSASFTIKWRQRAVQRGHALRLLVMIYLSEEALAQIATQQHRAAMDGERGVKSHRDRRYEALSELKARGWTNQRMADLLQVTEGAIRRMLKGNTNAG